MAHRICPVWLGYLLASPLRRLRNNPEAILTPFVREGMTVLDIGSAMGFFSLPMARMVGPAGRVVCVDIQPKMLDVLTGRARKAQLADRVETRLCTKDSLCLDGLDAAVDFALMFYVVHEVPDPAGALAEVHRAMKPGGTLLLAEPRGHVREEEFAATLAAAEAAGFRIAARPTLGASHGAALVKPS